MVKYAPTIAKRNPNAVRVLEVGKKYRILKTSGLYHWDTKFHFGSPYLQGTTYCFKRGEIVTYLGEEDEKPLFQTASGYIGIFRPTICGMVPTGSLELVKDDELLATPPQRHPVDGIPGMSDVPSSAVGAQPSQADCGSSLRTSDGKGLHPLPALPD